MKLPAELTDADLSKCAIVRAIVEDGWLQIWAEREGKESMLLGCFAAGLLCETSHEMIARAVQCGLEHIVGRGVQVVRIDGDEKGEN